MLIAVNNKSTLVQNSDLEIICQAIQIQLDLHVFPAWNLAKGTIKFYADASKIPGYAWVINVIDDDTQVPDALGYHEETNTDKIDGFIMCKPILSNGGGILIFDVANPGQYLISTTLSHEVIECIGDRFTNSYCDNKKTSWCVELCDPVEQIGYKILIDGVNVGVSDFVFPNFFNPYATLAHNAPFNYLNTLKKPFSILPGGYAIQRTDGPGTETQIFGDEMPQWRREMKTHDLSRYKRRLANKE